MQSNNFYIYEHIRPDTGMVFYVGKGCGKRLNCGKHGGSNRNKHWKAVVAKAGGFEAIKLVENLDEELAFLIEEERIDQLKRLGIKLTNQTLGGGGGIKGHRHTEETKQKISKHHKEFYKNNPSPCLGKFGKEHPAYGYKHTEKARKGMSENSCMKRPEVVAKISCKKSVLAKSIEYKGKVYKTMNDLAKHLGISAQSLRSRIFRGQSKKYGYKVLGKTKDFMQGQDLAPLNAAIEVAA